MKHEHKHRFTIVEMFHRSLEYLHKATKQKAIDIANGYSTHFQAKFK